MSDPCPAPVARPDRRLGARRVDRCPVEDRRRSSRPWRGAVVLLLTSLLAALAMSLPTVSASADPAAPPTGPSTTLPTPAAPAPPLGNDPNENTWSLSPTGADKTNPSSRPNFSFEAAPGTTITDSATVWNYSAQPRTFDVYARDAFNTPQGGIDLLTKDKQSTDVGGWVHLANERVTVPAGAGYIIPFSLVVPENATPGDHDAGIVASIVTSGAQGDGKQVLVDHRVGVRLYLRVTGPVTPVLTVEDMHSEYHGSAGPLSKGSLDVTYTVHNTGNISLKAHQALTVHGLFGWTLADLTPADIPELLPNASVAITQHFDGISPAVRLTSEVTITPYLPPAEKQDVSGIEPITVSTTVWALPWGLLALLAFVLLVLLAVRVVRRLRRRRAAGRAQDPGTASVGDGAGGGDGGGDGRAAGDDDLDDMSELVEPVPAVQGLADEASPKA
jgi:hypothetical protein